MLFKKEKAGLKEMEMKRKKEENIEVARKALEIGFPTEKIEQITGLSSQEIQNIRTSITKQ